ncbi:MAG: hypothetical protein R2711_16440 [Acidimicrobiales bacterium]
MQVGREAGVQDQWAAALGGAGLLAIGPYPEVRHRSIEVPARASVELGERLVTVVFGPHDSSAVHRQVIDALVTCSGSSTTTRARPSRRSRGSRATPPTRSATATSTAGARCCGGRWRRSALHPDLVGAPHRRAIRWPGPRCHQVEGQRRRRRRRIAHGPRREAPGGFRRLADALGAADPTWAVLRLRPAPGLAVTLV